MAPDVIGHTPGKQQAGLPKDGRALTGIDRVQESTTSQTAAGGRVGSLAAGGHHGKASRSRAARAHKSGPQQARRHGVDRTGLDDALALHECGG
jgi:hypothetical protein